MRYDIHLLRTEVSMEMWEFFISQALTMYFIEDVIVVSKKNII